MPGSTTASRPRKSAARAAAKTTPKSAPKSAAKPAVAAASAKPTSAPAPAAMPAPAPIPPAPRKRFVAARIVEKTPPQHGEKPYAQLVFDAFDGPVLRLSQKMKLLEEADNRKIRRGDALDLIAATQRELEAKHKVRKRVHPLEIFFKQYAVFVACYVAFALIWCGVMSLSSSTGGAASAARAMSSGVVNDASRISQVNAARVDPPFDQ
jgi:hypothetical protein